jgi:hypothetical protein
VNILTIFGPASPICIADLPFLRLVFSRKRILSIPFQVGMSSLTFWPSLRYPLEAVLNGLRYASELLKQSLNAWQPARAGQLISAVG